MGRQPSEEVSFLDSSVGAFVHRFAVHHGLSARETTVLALAAAGLHRKESASRLGCSLGTVDTYWRRIFRKTGRTSQSELFVALLAFAIAGERGAPAGREATIAVPAAARAGSFASR
jgi:DNA-binding CsgD family transcriptional regulator